MTLHADYSGADLIKLGFKPGPAFGPLLNTASRMRAHKAPLHAISDRMIQIDAEMELRLEAAEEERRARQIDMRARPLPYAVHLERGTSEAERAVYDEVTRQIEIVSRTPVISGVTLMPDAHPVGGGDGNIPVGGAAVSSQIHPGLHSADVCCSVAMTVFRDSDPKSVLDRVHAATHFGPGGRSDTRYALTPTLAEAIRANPLTRPLMEVARSHLGTQGDGNHFSFVGTLRSTGQTCLVTHHGSRGFGAGVYKRGMEIAEATRRALCPELPKPCAWITADSAEGEMYWQALQIVRDWTLENHLALHTAIADPIEGFMWNEHNFVFRRSDGLFYHGKGATPATFDYPLTLVPLNMAQPVLVTRGLNSFPALGFAPHGAGRLVSRTVHRTSYATTGPFAHRADDYWSDKEALRFETRGLDVRFYNGFADVTELPSAYKDAATVRRQMESYGLAEVVDEVVPYGCIMAGDLTVSTPWKRPGMYAQRSQ